MRSCDPALGMHWYDPLQNVLHRINTQNSLSRAGDILVPSGEDNPIGRHLIAELSERTSAFAPASGKSPSTKQGPAKSSFKDAMIAAREAHTKTRSRFRPPPPAPRPKTNFDQDIEMRVSLFFTELKTELKLKLITNQPGGRAT